MRQAHLPGYWQVICLIFIVLLPLAARVFKGNGHVGQGMSGVLLHNVVLCCHLLSFCRINTFKYPTVVSSIYVKLFFCTYFTYM